MTEQPDEVPADESLEQEDGEPSAEGREMADDVAKELKEQEDELEEGGR